MIQFISLLFIPSFAFSELPEGYDENTELTIKGTVTEIVQSKRGPVIIRLKVSDKTYNVATAPGWYLLQQGISFDPNSEFEITGSKYYMRDGNLYIISRQLRNTATGKVIILRDSYFMPLWRGHGRFK